MKFRGGVRECAKEKGDATTSVNQEKHLGGENYNLHREDFEPSCSEISP